MKKSIKGSAKLKIHDTKVGSSYYSCGFERVFMHC